MPRQTLADVSQADATPRSSHALRALLMAQFLGAFNDNVYKMVVSLLAVQEALKAGAGSAALALVSAVFISPFLLFSGYAGHAADVLSKRTVLVVTKFFEVLVMGLACGALLSGRLDYMLSVLFLLATQATFFGPAKYGLLPEILPARDLARANGLIEMSTFVAIILGTALGTAMFVIWYKQLEIIGLCLIAMAVAGTAASLRVPSVPPSGARQAFRLNPWGEICRGLKRLAHEGRLGLTVLGIAFFWLLAALMQMAVLLFGKEVMGLDDLRVGLLGTFLALGIGAGSLTAGRLSGQKVELGLVPLGALGMGTSTLLLSLCVVVYPHGSHAGGARLRRRLVHRPLASLPAIQKSSRRTRTAPGNDQLPQYGCGPGGLWGLVGVPRLAHMAGRSHYPARRPWAPAQHHLRIAPLTGLCRPPGQLDVDAYPVSHPRGRGGTYPEAGAGIARLQSCLLRRWPPRRGLCAPLRPFPYLSPHL
jgi:hypothetical protein